MSSTASPSKASRWKRCFCASAGSAWRTARRHRAATCDRRRCQSIPRPVSFRGHGYLQTPVYRRETLGAGFSFSGPAIVEEPDSTTVVHPGDTCNVRQDGMLEVELG